VPISERERLKPRHQHCAARRERRAHLFHAVFRHNFFHADMHPGNIFVLVDDPQRPRYAPWISASSAHSSGRSALPGENFLAVFDRDYRRVAQLHLQSGWCPRTRESMRWSPRCARVRTDLRPPAQDISFGRILLRLFEISRRFNMQIQPQLILLQKTPERGGLGRELYPDSISEHASPILRE